MMLLKDHIYVYTSGHLFTTRSEAWIHLYNFILLHVLQCLPYHVFILCRTKHLHICSNVMNFIFNGYDI